MFSAFERLVAFRYLRARRQEGFISVIAIFSFLGILLGVATLIIVMSVMNGFRKELLDRIIGINGHVGIYGPGEGISDYEELANRLAKLPNVISAFPMIQRLVLATTERGLSDGVQIRGLQISDMAQIPLLASTVRAGALSQLEDGNTIAIGTRFASRMGLKIDDYVTLISPEGTETPFMTVPRMKDYRVGAIFEVGMYEIDSNVLFMSLPSAQVFFRMPDSAGVIELRVADPEQLEPIMFELYRTLSAGYQLTDWQRSNASIVSAVAVERNVMFLILTLIIIVAAFNIISSQIMLVKDKGRAIAILRTMGATRGAIMRIFLLTGATIGVIGTAAGFALGLLFSLNIESVRQFFQYLSGVELFPGEVYFLSQLPAIVDPWEVVGIVGMALALTFLATLYPAWRAARLDPVEALRYE